MFNSPCSGLVSCCEGAGERWPEGVCSVCGQLAVPADHRRGLALLPPALGPAADAALRCPHPGGQVPCSAQEAAVTRRCSSLELNPG